MKRSAAESSSAVVTPGGILPSSSRSVRTRMSPAAAILATSSGVLRMITGESVRRSVVESGAAIVVPAKDAGRAQWRSHGSDRGRTQGRRGQAGCAADLRMGPLDLFLEPESGEGCADVVVHLGRRARAVEPLEDPTLVVEVHERLGLLAVGVQSLAHGLGLVVVALEELEPVDVADALVLGLV